VRAVERKRMTSLLFLVFGGLLGTRLLGLATACRGDQA
jgi:hypothetical protein